MYRFRIHVTLQLLPSGIGDPIYDSVGFIFKPKQYGSHIESSNNGTNDRLNEWLTIQASFINHQYL